MYFRKLYYQLKHIFWIIKIAKKHFNYVPIKFFIHDLDKIFLLRDKKCHVEKVTHHIQFLLKNPSKATILNVREMICDWECARFFKTGKPLTARQYFEVVKLNFSIPDTLISLIQTELDRYNF